MEMHTRQSLMAARSFDPMARRTSRSVIGTLLRLLARLYRTIVSAICAARTHRRNQRDYGKLLMQPDYLLKDVGLTRWIVLAAKDRSLF